MLVAAAAVFLAASTAFRPELSRTFVTVGGVAAAGAMVVAVFPRRIATGIGLAAGGAAAVAPALLAYVHWQPYVRQLEADSGVAWSAAFAGDHPNNGSFR